MKNEKKMNKSPGIHSKDWISKELKKKLLKWHFGVAYSEEGLLKIISDKSKYLLVFIIIPIAQNSSKHTEGLFWLVCKNLGVGDYSGKGLNHHLK